MKSLKLLGVSFIALLLNSIIGNAQELKKDTLENQIVFYCETGCETDKEYTLAGNCPICKKELVAYKEGDLDYTFVYPIKVTKKRGKVVTVNNDDELTKLYEGLPKGTELNFNFPLSIEFEDGYQEVIKNTKALDELLSFSSYTNNSKENEKRLGKNYYTQGVNNRTAAEWEPTKGVIIAWPLAIPHKLAIELANDSHLYTVVKDQNARNEAQSWFNRWGISSDKVTFITTDQGEWSWWSRDWGPSAVFTPSKQYFISNGKFVYGDPTSSIGCNDKLEFELETDQNGNLILTTEEDNAPITVANKLGAPVLDLPFINTGGNVATDGMKTAFSTCILINENKRYGVNRDNFLQMNKELLGFEQYNVISNFEQYGIQHIDCFMKIINEETILVAETPNDHPMRSVYENIVNNELSKLKTAYGRPYKILRIKIARYKNDDLAAYTNSLILNKTIYVPLFNIAQDVIALETWKKAMPGYIVKGFKYTISDEPIVATQVSEQYGSYGWNYGDALHCRVRAVWDPKMLFVTTKKISSIVKPNDKKKVHTTIIDYSGSGIDKNKSKLFWRVKGQSNWNGIVLTQAESGNSNHFFAEIPHNEPGTTVEYYISAVSNSGKTETQPRTAPTGSYMFEIQ